ncbi:MAG: NADH-quinone oxidoreductase subunit NuoH [Planctomycetes bacterium]|nr:NADH-quinone oxidoreductase subunit NuoH [Planctomycetota bacterium]
MIRGVNKQQMVVGGIGATLGGFAALVLLFIFRSQLADLLADQFYFSLFLALGLFGIIMTAVAYCILLERKISAWVQDRYGPNRVGPLGLLQPLADGIKLFMKEDIIPRHVDKGLFVLAPFLAFVISMIGYAVIPWGGEFRWPWMPEGETLKCQVASIDIALLYILAVGSMGVYGVVLAGWASNNKYAMYGAMRASAQMLSYEVPLAMMVLVAILTSQSMRLEDAVAFQAGSWWTFAYHPLAALILFIAALAEANRAPFDLAEAEQELIAGFHTEYSAIKWAMFFLGEYTHMITSSAVMVSLFFGGYLLPDFLPGAHWVNESTNILAMFARMGVLFAKIGIFIAVYMMVRWTLPRFRYDQLMSLAWKAFVPMGMLIVLMQVLIIYNDWPQWYSLIGNIVILLAGGLFSAAVAKPITGRQVSLLKRERGMT